MCTFFAVILNRFTTLKGKRICSGPGKVWTQTSMAYLDGKNRQIQHANCHHHWHNIHLHTKRQESKMKSSQLIICYLISTDWMFFFLQTPYLILVTLHDIITLAFFMYSFNYVNINIICYFHFAMIQNDINKNDNHNVAKSLWLWVTDYCLSLCPLSVSFAKNKTKKRLQNTDIHHGNMVEPVSSATLSERWERFSRWIGSKNSSGMIRKWAQNH